jgi:hypothetical protein
MVCCARHQAAWQRCAVAALREAIHAALFEAVSEEAQSSKFKAQSFENCLKSF